MAENPSAVDSSIFRGNPLARELTAVFDTIEADHLISQLQKTVGRGPKGFRARSLFRVFLASYYLNVDSIAETVRQLQNNPALAWACDVDPLKVPSRPTLSRFFSRLSDHTDELHGILTGLTGELRNRLPDFGKHIAIDSSTVRTHSNPDRKPVVDQDAAWTAKGYKTGYNTKQWSFGYKLHMAVDAESEMPIAAYVTPGNAADSTNLLPLLEQARQNFDWFKPESVIADKGYDSQANNKAVIEDFKSVPIIAMRELRQGAKKRRPKSQHRVNGVIPRWSVEWADRYAMRTSVERTFGRLKENRRLERHCYRGLEKVTAHCLMSLAVMQAMALVQIAGAGDLRACRRAVA